MSKENDLLSAAHLGGRRRLLQNPFVHRPLMDVRATPLGWAIVRSAQNSKRGWPSMVQGAVAIEGRLTRDEDQNIWIWDGRPRRVLQLANSCAFQKIRRIRARKKEPW